MPPRGWLFAGAVLATLAPGVHAQEPPSPQPPPIIRAIRVVGAKELPEADLISAARLRPDAPLPAALDRIEDGVARRYRDAGYAFARVRAAFDDPTGALTLTIDEGVIDRVEFKGVDESLARSFARDFALRAGDVFNRTRAAQALDALLQPTRGAVRPGRAGGPIAGSQPPTRRRAAFDLVDDHGERVLIVGLQERAGRFHLDGTDREDWFTPVDGFVPAFGFGAAAFDHEQFNHTFIAGHVSYKMARDKVGYALGFERPFFSSSKLYVGGEVHDLTASDDWQVSSLEAILAAIGPRKSFRDYYRRRGIQVNGAWRLAPEAELFAAWRDERQEPLSTETDFSVWNGDHAFRPNLAARGGRLHAVVLGASVDGAGFGRESLEATYRRHQLDTPFGTRLRELGEDQERAVWRVDWSSEISAPGALGSDFDFQRHIVSARARLPLSLHQEFAVRAIGGWSDGILPPQRQFAIGGIGSVHGYQFKEAVGDSLALVNLEYAVGWRHDLQAIAFFDAGRVGARAGGDAPWLKGVGVGISQSGFRVDVGYKLDAVPRSLQVLLRFGRTF